MSLSKKSELFLMGLPGKWNWYAFIAVLAMLPLAFLAPVFVRILAVMTGYTSKRDSIRLSLFHRCLSVLLAYMMLLTPCGLQSIAEGSIFYSELDTRHWSEGNRTIHYQYDDNGSVIEKKTSVTSPEQVLETITYDYNLQNRLERVTREYVQDSNDIDEVTEYTYNGVRPLAALSTPALRVLGSSAAGIPWHLLHHK